MRAFVAIELSESARRAVEELIARLRETKTRVSWVKPENLHLTLRFLGDVDPTQVEALRAMMAKELAGLEPFRISLSGCGAFPNLRRPRLIWVGLSEPWAAIEEVYGVCERCARAIGLDKNLKSYHPHVTLGRIRSAGSVAPLTKAIETESGFHGGDFEVASVSLFRSTLARDGAVYNKLDEFALKWTST